MILPSTYLFSMILLIVSVFCWGSWASTYKAAGKWRFELYYYDFAVGAVLAALIAALTFGSLGWDGFSFIDDVRNAGKRQDLWAFLGGCVFNLANMMILGSVSIAGMVIAFPAAMGMALLVVTIWNYFANPGGNPLLVGAGAACLLAAVTAASLAYRTHAMNRLLLLAQQGKTKSTKKSFNAKALFLAITGGILLGFHYPLVQLARDPDVGLGPYALVFMFSIGILFSTFVYNLFFMNLPVNGKVVDFSEYLKGSRRTHLLGLLGGGLWTLGAVTNFVAAKAEGTAGVEPGLSFSVAQGATLLAALWGLIVWKELEAADSKVKTLVTGTLVLTVVGIVFVSIAHTYSLR